MLALARGCRKVASDGPKKKRRFRSICTRPSSVVTDVLFLGPVEFRLVVAQCFVGFGPQPVGSNPPAKEQFGIGATFALAGGGVEVPSHLTSQAKDIVARWRNDWTTPRRSEGRADEIKSVAYRCISNWLQVKWSHRGRR